jgi:hypothetical protein
MLKDHEKKAHMENQQKYATYSAIEVSSKETPVENPSKLEKQENKEHPYKCKNCDKSYTKKESLKNHFNSQHLGSKKKGIISKGS